MDGVATTYVLLSRYESRVQDVDYLADCVLVVCCVEGFESNIEDL
jgi:hypothetical protein